ncbi:MAG: M23 family metallopeptidase [Pseudomonadota bacterium]
MQSRAARLKSKVLAHFPNHQIYFRTNGKVRFFTFTTGMQLTGVAVLCVSCAWFGKSTYDYIAQGSRLEANQVAMTKMSGRVDALTDDIEGLEGDILKRAEMIEARQNAMQSVLAEGIADLEPIDLETLTDDTLSSEDTANAQTDRDKSAFYQARPGRSKSEHFDDVFTVLEKRQVAFASELIRRAELERQAIFSTLETLKVDGKSFLAARDHSNDVATAAGVGGPVIALAILTDTDTPEVFDELFEKWTELTDLRAQFLSVPAISPLDEFYISSNYGRRRDPFTRRWAHHAGVDLAAWYGTPVHATSDGKVTYAGYKSGYGRVVEVNHGNGFVTRYGHLRKIVVKKGERVTMHTKLGETGNSGRSTGPHLHYEIWFDGKTINPVPFIKASNDVLKIQGRSHDG